MNFEVVTSDAAPYADGLWLDWGTTGEGVSSILMELALNSSGNSASYYAQYTVNITSSITINSIYTPVNESQKQVTVYCTLLNEGTPAAADNLEYHYQQDTPNSWIQATTPIITNYGNGTYTAAFLTQNTTQTDLPISVHCQDSRAISIWANTTSTQS